MSRELFSRMGWPEHGLLCQGVRRDDETNTNKRDYVSPCRRSGVADQTETRSGDLRRADRHGVRAARRKEFDEISIAELAQKAGYSVGAFYARFRSKDELFDAMVQQHVQNRRKMRQRQFATTDDTTLIARAARRDRPLLLGPPPLLARGVDSQHSRAGILDADAQAEPRVRRLAARRASRARAGRALTAPSRPTCGSPCSSRSAYQQHDPEPPRPVLPRAGACSSRTSCERSGSSRATMSSSHGGPRGAALRNRRDDRRYEPR